MSDDNRTIAQKVYDMLEEQGEMTRLEVTSFFTPVALKRALEVLNVESRIVQRKRLDGKLVDSRVYRLASDAVRPERKPVGRPKLYPNKIVKAKRVSVTDKLNQALAGHPEGRQLSIIRRIIKAPHSALHRAANNLGVIRKTTGFGPNRTTLWRLPHLTTSKD